MFPCIGKSSSVTRQPPASTFGRGLGELSSPARLPPRVQFNMPRCPRICHGFALGKQRRLRTLFAAQSASQRAS